MMFAAFLGQESEVISFEHCLLVRSSCYQKNPGSIIVSDNVPDHGEKDSELNAPLQ